MRRIVRTEEGWAIVEAGGFAPLLHGLDEMLLGAPITTVGPARDVDGPLLAPVGDQEVWAAGVTYERSLHAREEESKEPDVYERVYASERPELFFKSPGRRVLGPTCAAGIRPDSTWDVPEPEVVVVLDANGRIFGYVLGDDVSSRSIEGDNPLYLPQAKVYDGSCVIGPWILPAADVDPPFDLTLRVRRRGDVAFEGTTSTAKMQRSFQELAAWLFAALPFPTGVLLMTGTGIVPDASFTLQPSDVVEIDGGPLGRLDHGMRRLDTPQPWKTTR